jgi:hypothetical protein
MQSVDGSGPRDQVATAALAWKRLNTPDLSERCITLLRCKKVKQSHNTPMEAHGGDEV